MSIRFEIKAHIGTIKENPKNGWKKELNIVSWNGREPKFDIREWSPDYETMGKGITFTGEEAIEIQRLLEVAIKELKNNA